MAIRRGITYRIGETGRKRLTNIANGCRSTKLMVWINKKKNTEMQSQQNTHYGKYLLLKAKDNTQFTIKTHLRVRGIAVD